MSQFPFQTINWEEIPAVEYPGETGTSTWKVLQLPGLRIREVEYSAGYLADHWCTRGHIVHCLEGEFDSELSTGETVKLTAGMTYVVSDGQSAHRSCTGTGARLLIVDGAFLQTDKD